MVDTPGDGAPQPTATGADGQPQSNGQADLTPDKVKDLITESQSEFRKSIGLQDGQRVDHMIHGVTRKLFDIPDGKTGTQHIADTLAVVLKNDPAIIPPENTPPKPEDKSEIATLTEMIGVLQGTVKDLKDDNTQVKAQAAESTRITSVSDMVDKLGVDPKLAPAFKRLATSGMLDGIPKPTVTDAGELVVESQNGPVAFDAVLTGFIEANSHWAGEHVAPGSGAPGNTKPNLPAEFQFQAGKAGRAATAQAYSQNAESTGKKVDDRVSELGGKLQVKGL